MELAILRSEGGVGFEYFHDLRRGADAEQNIWVGADADSKKWDSAHLW